jgi:hypothetical protein
MKGTIFSSDFCVDESNNLRLLEINTDTSFITSTLGSEVDVTPIVSMMTGSIDSVYVIYKDAYHDKFVEYLSSSIASAHSHSFTAVAEKIDGIYPTSPSDADNKFIIRLAYDENAVLDSTYAKGKLNLLKLFSDNSAEDQVVDYYYSSSATGVIDHIDKSNLNSNNIIDAVSKKATEAHQTMKMYKIGHSTSGSSDRWNNFINEVKNEDSMIQKYHYNSNEKQGDKITSIRNYTFIYGTNLDQVSIGNYKVGAYFDEPDSLNDFNTANISSQLGTYYKYCFATNHMTEKTYGVWPYGESLISMSGDFILATNVSASNAVLSYFVSGSPEDNQDWYEWSHPGNQLPDGSHATGSLVLSSYEISASNNIISEIKTANATGYTSPNEAYLVYNSVNDRVEWEYAQNIFPNTHSVWVSGSGFEAVTEGNTGVTLTDAGYQQINVEADDNYQLSGSNFLVHNAPCFIAGTKITLSNGETPLVKNIEDVEISDTVLTYNLDNNQQEEKEVLQIQTKHNQPVVYLEFSNSKFNTCTFDHPFYVSGSGWSAYKPAESNITDRALTIGDKCLHSDGNFYEVTFIEENPHNETVYNLDEVADNNNFYANGFLVHNRIPPGGFGCCFVEGTEISLANEDIKNIEDIVIGDEVLSWNGEELVVSKVIDIEPTVVGDRDLYTINGEGICNIEFTPEHPFLTKQGWKALKPDVEEFGILEPGDEINCCGEWKAISSIDVIDSKPDQRVFNFTVKEYHNYVANGIIVHNK